MECTVLEHKCDVPCVWPGCLSDAEAQELVKEIKEDG